MLLIALLRRHPGLRAVLFERPEVSALAREQIAQAGLEARCQVVAGDMFQAVPSGGDYYFLRQILKDWTDEQDVRILGNCLRAMKPQGRILVAEQVLAPGRADLLAKLTDLVLMVTLPGHERDHYEFEQLFAHADLTLQRILPCIGYLGHPFVKKTSWAFITLLFLFIRWYFAIDRGGPCFSCTGCRRGLPETASDTTLPAGCTSSTDWPLEHVVPLQAAQR
jgi:O-methyltransferase domain